MQGGGENEVRGTNFHNLMGVDISSQMKQGALDRQKMNRERSGEPKKKDNKGGKKSTCGDLGKQTAKNPGLPQEGMGDEKGGKGSVVKAISLATNQRECSNEKYNPGTNESRVPLWGSEREQKRRNGPPWSRDCFLQLRLKKREEGRGKRDRNRRSGNPDWQNHPKRERGQGRGFAFYYRDKKREMWLGCSKTNLKE